MANKSKQIKNIIFTAILMAIGLILFKFIPMGVYGENILFDASMHIVIASFILYLVYFFIDENKNWRLPYLIFCFFVLAIISLQRIVSDAHSDIGLLLGVLISAISIIIPNWNYYKNRIKF
jgi:membrane protein CcdC involved in cytochrome C biogenesis